MIKLLPILFMSILLSTEMEVQGDLKVTGNIKLGTIDSLAQVILLQQQQISSLEALIAQLQAQMALIGGDLGYADCFGVVGGVAILDDCGICDGNNESKDICGDCGGDAILEDECTATDIDGNTYEVVKIGNQFWMAENLKTMSYANGESIIAIGSNDEWGNTLIANAGAYCNIDNNAGYIEQYGRLYNGYAAIDDRGLCMDDWHLATDDDWKELEIFLGMTSSEANSSGWRGDNQGSMLAGNSDLWNDGELENNEEFGALGFNAVPSGWRETNGVFEDMGLNAYYWTITNTGNSYDGYFRAIYFEHTGLHRNPTSKVKGMSVRCVKD